MSGDEKCNEKCNEKYNWMEELDQEAESSISTDPPRNPTKKESLRIDYLSKLCQMKAAEHDLMIAELLGEHEVMSLDPTKLVGNEKAVFEKSKSGLEISNARFKVVIMQIRVNCNVPYNAKLRGFEWWDDTDPRNPNPIVKKQP